MTQRMIRQHSSATLEPVKFVYIFGHKLIPNDPLNPNEPFGWRWTVILFIGPCQKVSSQLSETAKHCETINIYIHILYYYNTMYNIYICVLHIYSKSICVYIYISFIWFSFWGGSLGSKPRQVPYLTGELLLYLMMGWAVVLAWDSQPKIVSCAHGQAVFLCICDPLVCCECLGQSHNYVVICCLLLLDLNGTSNFNDFVSQCNLISSHWIQRHSCHQPNN